MAKRNTATDKWDDDWYLSLEPELKLVWDYLTLKCDGTGQIKISFKKLSDCIGGRPITREWLDEKFRFRIHWIKDDKLWLIGYIGFHYGQLDARIPAHRNVVRKLLRESVGWTLSEKGEGVMNALREFISGVDQSLTDPHSGADQDLERPLSNKNKNKNKNKNEKISSLSNEEEEETEPRFVIHPDLAGNEITDPIICRIAVHTQQNWLKVYGTPFGNEWLRDAIQACVLHYQAKEGSPRVQEWGVKLTNWLAEEKRRAQRGKRNDGLLSAKSDPFDIDFDGLSKKSGRAER